VHPDVVTESHWHKLVDGATGERSTRAEVNELKLGRTCTDGNYSNCGGVIECSGKVQSYDLSLILV